MGFIVLILTAGTAIATALLLLPLNLGGIALIAKCRPRLSVLLGSLLLSAPLALGLIYLLLAYFGILAHTDDMQQRFEQAYLRWGILIGATPGVTLLISGLLILGLARRARREECTDAQ